MTQTPVGSPQAPPRPRRGELAQPLTTSFLVALVAVLFWCLVQAQSREAVLRERLKNLAVGYLSQRETRRELYFARLTIARLRAGLETPVTPFETIETSETPGELAPSQNTDTPWPPSRNRTPTH